MFYFQVRLFLNYCHVPQLKAASLKIPTNRKTTKTTMNQRVWKNRETTGGSRLPPIWATRTLRPSTRGGGAEQCFINFRGRSVVRRALKAKSNSARFETSSRFIESTSIQHANSFVLLINYNQCWRKTKAIYEYYSKIFTKIFTLMRSRDWMNEWMN